MYDGCGTTDDKTPIPCCQVSYQQYPNIDSPTCVVHDGSHADVVTHTHNPTHTHYAYHTHRADGTVEVHHEHPAHRGTPASTWAALGLGSAALLAV